MTQKYFKGTNSKENDESEHGWVFIMSLALDNYIVL